MQTFRESYLYYFWCCLSAWLGRQWQGSRFVGWLTHQRETSSYLGGLGDRIHGRLYRLFRRLHLDRVLEGSLFLHPGLFAAGAVLLAPVVPTMAVLALVAGGLFSLLLRFGIYREQRLGAGPLGKYVALYAVVYLYAAATSLSVRGSLFPALLTVAFVLCFFVITSLEPDYQRIRRVAALAALMGLLVSAYGFYQLLFPQKFRSVWTDTDMFSNITFRVYSTLENPNVLGEYFLLVIPVGAALLLTAERWRERFLWLAVTGVMGLCLIVTYSRGCYLGLLLAAAIFLVLLDRRFLVVGIIAVALSPLYLPESVLTRFTSIGNMGDSSTSYRVSIWMGTLAMLKDYWFCGLGPGTEAFNVVYPRYAYNAITAPHSHNLYLQIICDTGFCGILVFGLLIVGFYRMVFTAIRRETDRRARIFQIAGVSAVSGFLLQSMTDYTFYNYRVLLLFWAILGACVLFCRMGRAKEEAAA